MTTSTQPVAFGGMIEVACGSCDWTHPTGGFTGTGTPERPACADYVDAAMPLIAEHIDATGHPVDVTLTTYTPGREEQSSMRFLPRTDESTT